MGKPLPGERAKHWADAVMTIWPIILVLMGGTVYGNSETVRNLIHGTSVVEADGQTEITATGLTFEESVVKNSQEVRAELDAIQAQLKKLSAKSNVKDSSLQQQIRKWHGNE